MSFADLGLSDELLRAITDSGYTEPTPIQRGAIPPVLMGKDMIGIAQTGTGKTAAFVLPLLERLSAASQPERKMRVLVVAPTRELAAQVAENFEKYGKYHKLSMALLIGGVQMGDQVKALEKGVDVLIATPGRLMDLFSRGKILLNGCDLLVIDEADRMLDMGFIPDIEEICTRLPKQRQTLLFSATMPPPIQKLAAKFLSDPRTIEVARPASANLNIEQRVWIVRADKKRDVLKDLLRADEFKNAIVFCNRKTTVRDLATALSKSGFKNVGQIHGDMEQAERIAEFDRFKRDEITVLVASDVAARGLDVKGVSHVINFDVPWQPDDYVHRIGRTGRAGMTGIAITLATKDDAEAVAAIEKLTSTKIPRFGDGAQPGAAVPVGPAKAAEEPERKPRARRERAPRERKPEEVAVAAASAKVDAPRSEVSADVVEAPARPSTRTPAGRTEAVAARAPAPATEPPRREQRVDLVPQPALDDDDWNGPMPSFLGVKLT